ncbi:uncharacterized MFS-type transporter C09D4.1-like [Neodiprion virginianus]|uniref:uncharacterized MFS-type transporter C09D4.1-like n=1 Tax=Neodiprion virginianus TaxID=2961670 RepID=UPI001EE6EB52|nr:uncharacterized MFS-type transporter C09D4.1-like [Neodiprion virginianus]
MTAGEKIELSQRIEDTSIEKYENFLKPDTLEVKVFKRRWLQLVLFVLFSSSNSVQWLQYTIITNIVCLYYNVSRFAVASTTVVLMVSYMLLLFPTSYLINRIGLRWTVVIGATVACLGAWIKVFSAAPDRFAVTLMGQCVVAVSQSFLCPVPGKLAACWFGKDQVALATAIGYHAICCGIISCFIVVPILVKNHESLDDIGSDLSLIYWIVAIFCTVVFLAVFFLFQDEPSLPPSESRALQKIRRESSPEGFLPPLMRVLRNRNYLLIWLAWGLNTSLLNTASTFCNPFLVNRFKNVDAELGKLELLFCLMGLIGSVIVASILDKTKQFRIIFTATSAMALLFGILYGLSYYLENKVMVFVSGGILAFFLGSYCVVAMEMCVEATYPESEAVVTGILTMSSQLNGIWIVLVTSKVLEVYGDIAAHSILCSALGLATLLTIFHKPELRRQKVQKYATRCKINAVQ